MAEYISGFEAYHDFTKPSGDRIKDWVGEKLKPKPKAGKMFVGDPDTAPINDKIHKFSRGLGNFGKALKIGDFVADSMTLGEHLSDLWKHGKILTDEERNAKKDSTDYKAK